MTGGLRRVRSPTADPLQRRCGGCDRDSKSRRHHRGARPLRQRSRRRCHRGLPDRPGRPLVSPGLRSEAQPRRARGVARGWPDAHRRARLLRPRARGPLVPRLRRGSQREAPTSSGRCARQQRAPRCRRSRLPSRRIAGKRVARWNGGVATALVLIRPRAPRPSTVRAHAPIRRYLVGRRRDANDALPCRRPIH